MCSALKEHKNCKITGIEIDANMASVAKKRCDDVIEGDIQSMDIKKELGEEAIFDVVLMGDVLEHLTDPGYVLQKIRPFLKEKGLLLVSVPNIAHSAIIFELLQGKFPYREEGLLDYTHLRFFTKESLINMLESKGFWVTSIERTIVPAENTEFRCDISLFPKETVQFIKNLPDSDTYQFIIRAVKDRKYYKEEKLRILEEANKKIKKELKELKEEIQCHNEAKNELKHLGEKNKKLTTQLLDLEIKNTESKHTKEELASQLKEYQNNLEIMLNSKSWKITAPLRRLRRVF
jgi:SAM-dependent methyltransferase